MLSDTKEFYHLCRKYKYYYNAYKKIEDLKDIYWSKYIKDAYDEIRTNLLDIEKEMIYLILDDLETPLTMIKIEKSRDNQRISSFHKRAIIDNSRLIDILERRNMEKKFGLVDKSLSKEVD